MARVALVSIAPVEINVNRGASVNLHFDACSGDKKYSVGYCEDRIEFKEVWITARECERIPIPIKGEEVARDLMTNEWLEREGVVVSSQPCECGQPVDSHAPVNAQGLRPCVTIGSTCLDLNVIPSDSEIAQGHATRLKWLHTYIEHGDVEYSRTKRIDMIPEFCKRAVRERGLKREWAFTAPPSDTFQCEGCGTMLQRLNDGSKPAKCMTCGAIVDREKAERLGFTQAPTANLGMAPAPTLVEAVLPENIKLKEPGPGSKTTQFKKPTDYSMDIAAPSPVIEAKG